MRTPAQNSTPSPACRRPLPRATAGNGGFTLVELLVTMSIASLLVGLLVAGVRGFTSGSNRRSAIGALMGVLDQARTVAISDGRATYVVFVSTTRTQTQGDQVAPAMWGRAYALFEDPVLQDASSAASFVPQQRSAWLYLPSSIAFKCKDNGDSSALSVTAFLPADISPTPDPTTFNVPKTGGGVVSLSLPYVKFDATGQIIDFKGNIPTPNPPPLHLLLFEGLATNAGVETFTRRKAISAADGQRYALDEIVLKPITGRSHYTQDPVYNLTAAVN